MSPAVPPSGRRGDNPARRQAPGRGHRLLTDCYWQPIGYLVLVASGRADVMLAAWSFLASLAALRSPKASPPSTRP